MSWPLVSVYKGSDGGATLDEWTWGGGKGQQTEAALARRSLLLARNWKRKKMVKYHRCKCSVCRVKDSLQRKKSKKLCQKKNKKTRY